jgi:hypothetical protein
MCWDLGAALAKLALLIFWNDGGLVWDPEKRRFAYELYCQTLEVEGVGRNLEIEGLL